MASERLHPRAAAARLRLTTAAAAPHLRQRRQRRFHACQRAMEGRSILLAMAHPPATLLRLVTTRAWCRQVADAFLLRDS